MLVNMEILYEAYNNVCGNYKLIPIEKFDDFEFRYRNRELFWLMLLIPSFRDAIIAEYVSLS